LDREDYRDRAQLNVYKKVLFSQLPIVVRDQYLTYLDGVMGDETYPEDRKAHVGQISVHFKDWRYHVLDWGRRTGKTICAAAEVVAEMGLPDRRIWIVAPNYELTDRVFEYVYKWIVIDKVLGEDSVEKASAVQNNRFIKMKWGSFVRGKSAESPDSLVGDQLDLIIFDECARCNEMIWTENLEPTTIDRKGRVLFISTPRGKNWFYDYFMRAFNDETADKGWLASTFKTSDNPFIDKAWLMSKKAETPEIVWRREYEASFEDFGGLVYPEFRARLKKDGGHLFDPKVDRLSSDWPVYCGIDIGFRLPTACVWGKVDPKGNLWIFREYEEAGLVHEDHAQNIKALSAEPVYQTYISPDASRRSGMQRDDITPIRIYRKNGIYTRPADDQVNPGLSLVARYLRASLEASPSHPQIFISVGCPKTIRAIENYQFLDVHNRQDLDQPDKPRKKDDHIPDALRYLITARPRFLTDWKSTDVSVREKFVERYGYQNSSFRAKKKGRSVKTRNVPTGRPKIIGVGR
jgi:hypothetical protein